MRRKTYRQGCCCCALTEEEEEAAAALLLLSARRRSSSSWPWFIAAMVGGVGCSSTATSRQAYRQTDRQTDSHTSGLAQRVSLAHARSLLLALQPASLSLTSSISPPGPSLHTPPPPPPPMLLPPTADESRPKPSR